MTVESYTTVIGTLSDRLKNCEPVFFGPVVINRSNYYFGIGFRQPFENCTISRCTMFSTHVTESLFLFFDVF